jgi:hypothetical protein
MSDLAKMIEAAKPRPEKRGPYQKKEAGLAPRLILNWMLFVMPAGDTLESVDFFLGPIRIRNAVD